MRLRSLICLAALGLSPALAQDGADKPSDPNWQQALDSAEKDLQGALTKLNATRAKIAKEKPALATEFEKIRSELISKRRQAELARMTRQDRAAAMADDRRTAQQLKQDLKYTSGLVGDLPNQMSTRASAAELANLAARFPEKAKADMPVTEQLAIQATVISSALDRIDSLLGGQIIESKAVSSDGTEIKGKVALLGPISIFSNEQTGGQLHDTADLIPKLSGKSNPEAARQITSGQASAIQLDLTGGAAKALSDLDSGPLDLIKKGGAWVYPILLIALVSAICGIIKFLQLAKIRSPRDGWVANILDSLRNGEVEAAHSQAEAAKHPVGKVFSKAIDAEDAGADVVEEVIYESMIGVQGRLQKWLPFIAITAATAPLLGLLGTVSGMIRTFNVIQIFGSGDPKPLAGGISEALITTLFGLVVAIPALIIHAMLSRRCQGILQTTEQLGLTLVNGLRRDELKKLKR